MDVENDISGPFRRDGQGQFSPVIASYEDMVDDAISVAQYLESTGRRSLHFAEIFEEMPRFVPDCARYDIDMEYMEDSESNSGHVGGLKREELIRILDGRQHCAECPIRLGCLSMSMTQKQLSNNRRTEPTLPLKPGTPADTPKLVMNEYLIFGGYTPQERRIIFNHVSEVLSLFDSWEMSGKIAVWDDLLENYRDAAVERLKENEAMEEIGVRSA